MDSKNCRIEVGVLRAGSSEANEEKEKRPSSIFVACKTSRPTCKGKIPRCLRVGRSAKRRELPESVLSSSKIAVVS